jgi:hypothetical protein
LLKTAVALVPEARVLRNYDEELEDVKGMNAPAYALDMELIQTAKKRFGCPGAVDTKQHK